MNGAPANETPPQRKALSDLGAGGDAEIAKPGFAWPKEISLHLVARDLRRRDGVGEFCLQLADMFSENDVPVRLYAENWNVRETPTVAPITALARRVQPADLIFFHFSTADPALSVAADLPARKILYFHGITPPVFFERYDPAMAMRAREGLQQLALATKFDRLMSNSRASAEELRRRGGLDIAENIVVCPPVLGIGRWAGFNESAIDLPPVERFILYVGRLAPHKSVHRLMLAFGELAKRDPRTGLAIVGQNSLPSYGRELTDLKAAMPEGIGARVAFLGGVDIASLRYLYEKAALFATFSEHEGFCLPVIEALNFGLPVLAGPDQAIRELLGGVGQIATTDTAAAASAMSRLLDDEGWRQKVIAGQHAQFDRLAATTNGAPIWQTLESVLGPDARPL